MARLVRHPWAGWAATAARLVLAGVFGFAGILKVGDPAEMVRSARAYKLLPESVVVPFAHALPYFEIALAVLLLLGVALRFVAVVSSVVMLMFVAGISSAAARGLKIDCGCFGDGGPTDDPQYTIELIRDGLLLALAVGLAVVGWSRLALDPPGPGDAPTPHEHASRADQRRERIALARWQADQERAGKRRRLYAVAAAAVLVIAALTGIAAGRASAPKASSPTPAGVTSQGGVLVGSSQAPRHLVVYEDPQCPACEIFEKAGGLVVAEAVSKGLVQVEYRMRSFLGPESVRAVAALGAAVASGRFEQLREQMFAHQPKEQTGGYTIDDLLSLGAAAGITDETYQEAVRRQSFAPWARRVDDQASRDGNVSTPELRLDGRTLSQEVVFKPALLAAALGLTTAE